MTLSLLLNIYYSVYSYIWVVLIFLLFIIYINVYSTLLLNTNFKLFSHHIFIKYNFFFFLLSLAGVPPLLGFLNKIFILNIILFLNNTVITLLFITLNTFLLVFYIQQVKFLQSSKKKFIFFKQNYNYSTHLIQFFIIMQFINQFAIILVPNLLILFSYNILCIIKLLLINVCFLELKKNKNLLHEC